ncbi:hypothetical protein [Paenibacillus dakarensis]|uniref:hypothetical protein n=1 Tax=Paenibacillus dakarensis TaxID=1527293 RepID=UPI0006D5516F|nr:hypothetical protein [Paenibacillus dakarensis]
MYLKKKPLIISLIVLVAIVSVSWSFHKKSDGDIKSKLGNVLGYSLDKIYEQYNSMKGYGDNLDDIKIQEIYNKLYSIQSYSTAVDKGVGVGLLTPIANLMFDDFQTIASSYKKTGALTDSDREKFKKFVNESVEISLLVTDVYFIKGSEGKPKLKISRYDSLVKFRQSH